jgi:hypothetical protein
MDHCTLTFDRTDKLQLKDYALTLERFIETERAFVDGSLVLSLNAPFGSGKSTFLAMWRNDLAARRINDSKVPLPMVLNAWESDHCGDPLVAIVSGISAAIDSQKVAADNELSALREAAKDAAWFALGMGNEVISAVMGVDTFAAGEKAEEKKAERGNAGGRVDLLKVYESRLSALRALKEALGKLFEEAKAPGYVFVDELDRCRPDYAVSYIETIKHVFDSPDLVFILAVDKDQLRSSVRALYGELNFDEYYRKFVHRNVTLPALNGERAERLINHYFNRYFKGGKIRPRHSRMPLNEFNVTALRELILGMRLTLRQIEEMFRIVAHAVAHANEKSGKIYLGYSAVTILLAALSVGRVDLYRAIGHRTASLSQLGDFLKGTITEPHSFQWWLKFLTIIYTVKRSEDPTEEILTEWKRLGVVKGEASAVDVSQATREFGSAFGRGFEIPDPIALVYRHVEDVKEFSD